MKVAIVGLPKSGTSVIYENAKQHLGNNTFYLFEPTSPHELRYLRWVKDRDVLTKLMVNKLKDSNFNPNAFNHVVVVVRDPRDVLISSLLYRFNRTGIAKRPDKLARAIAKFEQKEQHPETMSVQNLFAIFGKTDLSTGLIRMKERYQEAIQLVDQHNHAAFLRYESFLENGLQSSAVPIFQNPAPIGSLNGWISKISRKGTSGDWKNWFTKDDVEVHAELVPTLSALGYDQDFSFAETPCIDQEHCSLYIKRLVAQQKKATSIDELKSAAADGRRDALRKYALARADGLDGSINREVFDDLILAAQLGDEIATQKVLEGPIGRRLHIREGYLIGCALRKKSFDQLMSLATQVLSSSAVA